jgi:predicted membrane protein
MKETKRQQVNFLGPMLLIFVGCVLLLNVLGIVDWGVWWSILQLWPVFLIAAGLELLIGRRSRVGSLFVALLVMLILVGGLLLTTASIGTGGLDSRQIRQPRDDATQAEIAIDPVLGVLRLDALPESGDLVRGEILLNRDEEIVEEFTNQGGRANYRLKSEGELWTPFSFGDSHRVWDLGLSPGARLTLRPTIAVGQSELDLTGLDLSELNANMALGWTKVTLPAEGRFQANVSGAMGGITLIIPEGMAVRLNAGTAMVLRQVPADFQQQDNVFTSPGYASADNRVDLEVGLAMGVLDVHYADQ